MDDIDLNNLSPEMQADLNAYYDWLEEASGEQEMPEDFRLQPLDAEYMEDHMGRTF